MQYWPELYHDIRDFIELAQTESIELDLLEDGITGLLADQFVMTSGAAAVRRREQLLGIQADPTSESLEFRRLRIVNRYSTRPPFTIRYLQNQLDFLIGEGLATVSVNVQNFILRVTVDIPDAAVFREMQYTINAIKPANMVYQQATGLEDGIQFEETMSRIALLRETRLGVWRIGTVPFASPQQEVVIT